MRQNALTWIERACVAAALVCTIWSLLEAAQTHFYSSLPIPAAAASLITNERSGPRFARLPGEDPSTTGVVSRGGSLPPGQWLARLEAPSVGLQATVIEGSSDDMLARAAGHIEQTPLPGEPGNVGIAGHRDTTFRRVRKLAVGDPLVLTTATGRYLYRITRTFIVKPESVSVLDPTPRPTLTLVTCYPFTFIGQAPMRYIVRAELQAASGPSR